MFNLAAIRDLAAADGPTTVTLSPASVHLILAALGAAENIYNWEGAGDELTAAEIDEIQAMTAAASAEIMGE